MAFTLRRRFMFSPPSRLFFGGLAVIVVVVVHILGSVLVLGKGGGVAFPFGRNWFDARELLRRDRMKSV